MPITHYGKSIQVTATAASAAYALPDGHRSYEIINRGASNAYISFGTTTAVAAIPDIIPTSVQLIPPGAVLSGDLQPGQTHVAVLAEAATARIIIQMGA